MKKVIFIIALFFSFFLQAQEKYKYVIVPSQFSFFKEADKYNLNSLTKSFFETEGFIVFYDTDIPDHLLNDRCEMLYADVLENNKLFTTNLNVNIKDCANKIIAESVIGTSRDKDFQRAYTIALRNALTSLRGKLNFANTYVKSQNKTQEIKEAKNIIKSEKYNNSDLIVDNQTIKNDKKEFNEKLTAIETASGYKLLNSKGLEIMVLGNTSVDNVFFAYRDRIQGILIRKINDWYFDYYEKGVLVSKKIDIAF
ncbi:hypothetical protein LXD69_01040 [Flavobacterium sediminilitoris]|uniref:Uncharacterized protein n=1 Tax=Flavobacterium sediminilitoris TaxID=2024526 RepID=A0ABY4HPG9_9FLAO|nr:MULTISPECIES: hypothetical protein [Flavobacterium]UOX34111.1 hypothetical protein LXD69_01040 [Flavobacterium sediminilitoris]